MMGVEANVIGFGLLDFGLGLAGTEPSAMWTAGSAGFSGSTFSGSAILVSADFSVPDFSPSMSSVVAGGTSRGEIASSSAAGAGFRPDAGTGFSSPPGGSLMMPPGKVVLRNRPDLACG